MNTNKAAYWIALGLLALGLKGEYQHGDFMPIHRFVSHAGVVATQISKQAQQTLAFARVLVSQDAGAANHLVASSQAVETLPAEAGVQTGPQTEAMLVGDRLQEQIRGQIREQLRARTEVLRAAHAEVRRVEIEQIHLRLRSQIDSGSSAAAALRQTLRECEFRQK